ncbi:MAG: hypothetical protein Salg2KO_00960 [Salibacteraceae bacterium]
MSSCGSVSKGLLGFEKRKHLKGYHFFGGSRSIPYSDTKINSIANTPYASDSNDILDEPNALIQHQDQEKIILEAYGPKDASNVYQKSASSSGQILNRLEKIELQNASSGEDPEPPTVSKSVPGIISLLISLANLLLFMYLPFIGLFTGVLAIVFGVKARRVGEKSSRILGTIAIIISAFTLFISFLFTMLLINGIQVFG